MRGSGAAGWRTTEKLTVITDSGGLHFDLHSKVLQTPEEVLGDAVLVAVRQVPAAEVVVVLLVVGELEEVTGMTSWSYWPV